MNHIIEVRDLVKRYGDMTAVNGVSFYVEQGEIFGLLGENGAGKTTTLEIIEGLRHPSSGLVSVLGHDSQVETAAVKQRIGVQLQSSSYFPFLNLKEMLGLFASFYQMSADPMELLSTVGLTEKAGAFIGELSGGQRQRFSIAASLINDPEVVFLDEPTTGLDPLARRSLWALITDIKKRGKTVVLTTHYLEEAELLCDRVAIMDRGKIVAMGLTHQLIEAISYPYTISFIAATGGAEAMTELAKFSRVETHGGRDNHYFVRLSTADDLPRALDVVRPTNPQGLTVRPASLEDVFVELTGRVIAEDAIHD
jgi:ABC-2 type transport system ATP-binding protein